jgi:hypothetical protein
MSLRFFKICLFNLANIQLFTLLNWHKNREAYKFICFFANTYREAVMLLEFSIQKFKEAEFFNEPTIYSRFEFICFFVNKYREAVFNEFSIQKFKEAEFLLEQTIQSQSSLFAFLQIRIEKRFCPFIWITIKCFYIYKKNLWKKMKLK